MKIKLICLCFYKVLHRKYDSRKLVSVYRLRNYHKILNRRRIVWVNYMNVATLNASTLNNYFSSIPNSPYNMNS